MLSYKKKLLSESPNGQGIVLDNFTVGGELDTAFDANVEFERSVGAVIVQSDDKIVIAGTFEEIGGVSRGRIARLDENGSLDTTFNPSASSRPLSLAQQSDGKILLGGGFTSVSGTTRNRIARLHENGDLDTSFNPNANNTVRTVTQQSDGKILVGGYFTSVSNTTCNYIARLHENGVLDTSFNSSINNYVYSIVQQLDKRILLSGNFGLGFARLHENGNLDTTFAPRVDSISTISSIVQQPDRKIIISGVFEMVLASGDDGVPRQAVARFQDSAAQSTIHTTSENVESVELFVASTSDSPAERQINFYANGIPFSSVKTTDNAATKEVFFIPPTFGAGVEITAKRTSLDYTPTIFGHVNVQEDDA